MNKKLEIWEDLKANNVVEEKALNYLQKNGLPKSRNERWKYTNLEKFLKSLEKEKSLKDYDLSLNNKSIFLEKDLSNEDYIKNPAQVLNDLYKNGVYNLNLDEGNNTLLIDLNLISNKIIANKINIKINKLSISNLFIEFKNDNQNKNFCDLSFNIILDEGSCLNIFEIDNLNNVNSLHHNYFKVSQKRDSVFNYFSFHNHKSLNRIGMDIYLNEKNSSCNVYGIYKNSQNKHLDFNFNIEHNASFTSSDVAVRGIGDDKSTAIFNAKAIVKQGVKQIKAFQNNKNIQLSKFAIINTKPELEIYADDVICTHGATIGTLDKDLIFYLRSRGISEKDAKILLSQSFLKEVILNSNLDDKNKSLLLETLEK